MCYKDGPQLPPLNFTCTCTNYGRHVIFYNERLTGVTYPDGYEDSTMYTELCEVIVKGKFSTNYIKLNAGEVNIQASFVIFLLIHDNLK